MHDDQLKMFKVRTIGHGIDAQPVMSKSWALTARTKCESETVDCTR
jgi:hypothetical protein